MRTYVDRRHAIIASSLIALIALSAVFATVTYEIFGAPVAELSRADDAPIEAAPTEELAATPEVEVLGEQETNDQETAGVARASTKDAVGVEADETAAINDSTTDAAVDSGQGQPAVAAAVVEADATVSGRVWIDANANGIQDSVGEPGDPSGVTVRLLDANRFPKQTTTTDASGEFSFTVEPGTYILFFDVEQESISPRFAGDDSSIDSDIAPATFFEPGDETGVPGGLSDTIDVAAGETNNTRDAGIIPFSPSVAIETAANGADSDEAPGKELIAGNTETVTFTYVITNTGNVALFDIVVADDKIGVIGCGANTLALRESMTCSATANVTEGPYATEATVSAAAVDSIGDPLQVSGASDPTHYLGVPPPLGQLNLTMLTNGNDANAPGPELLVGEEVRFLYTVANVGNLDLIDISVVDDQVGDICTIPSLPVGEERDCAAIAEVDEGQYRNKGTATATVVGRDGATSRIPVESSDLSYHVGLAPVVEAAYPCPTTVEGPRLQRNNDGLLEWDSGLVAAPGSTIEITTSEPGASPGQPNEQVYVQVGDELFGPTPNEHTTTTFTVTEGGLVRVVHYSVIETTSFGSNSVNFTLCGSGLTAVK